MRPDANSRTIFLDRDGTLIRNYHYGCDPERVSLLPGVSQALRWLGAAGYRLIVVTNQSGVAHGYLTERDLARMHERLRGILAAEGVGLEAIYYCPHSPEGVNEYAGQCLCRKPEPGLFFWIASERRIALTQSWYVGDVLSDIEAGNRAGCRTVLVDVGTEPMPDSPVRTPTYVARNLPHAARLVLATDGYDPGPVEPLSLSALDRPRLTQGLLLPGDPSPIPDARWAIQAVLEGMQ